MIPSSIYIKVYKKIISDVMNKCITNFPIISFIFQQLKSQISKIYQNWYNSFCDETLQLFLRWYPDNKDLEWGSWLAFGSG